MKTIEQLRKRLEAIGATLDDSSSYTLNCDAPSGYVWRANGCRAVAIHYASNSQSWLVEAVKDAIKHDLAMGLEKVTDENEIASHKWDSGDDSWGAPLEAPDRIEWK